jgi:ABC-type oligopeptide transport system substrate-binding subunit
MKRRQTTALLIAALLAIALSACGGKKAAATPTEAFKAFYEASKNKDVAALKKLMSKATIAEMERKAKDINKPLDDYLADESQRGLPQTAPETGEEKIDGDTATVQFRFEKSAKWGMAPLIKEDGEWKINFK